MTDNKQEESHAFSLHHFSRRLSLLPYSFSHDAGLTVHKTRTAAH
ncbi:MAG: hypothetical protein U0K35_02185 [Prevotella sp.]|nr:hypothetical protein [Prevotella sp.]